MKFCISLLGLLALCFAVAAGPRQCWGQSPKTGPVFTWKKAQSDTDQLLLWKDGKQIGNWSIKAQTYWPCTRSGWGPQCDAPFPVPAWAVVEDDEPWWVEDVAPSHNFGIQRPPERRERETSGERRGAVMEINGSPATRAEVVRALEKGVPSDANKYRLTIIGHDAERHKVEKDWVAHAGDLKDKTLLWSVPPDHWSVHDNVTGLPMFTNTGKPTVYVTDHRGKVIYHEDDYLGAKDIEAIRKRVDGYEASKDPGRFYAQAGYIPPMTFGGLVVGGLAVGLLVRNRRRKAA